MCPETASDHLWLWVCEPVSSVDTTHTDGSCILNTDEDSPTYVNMCCAFSVGTHWNRGGPACLNNHARSQCSMKLFVHNAHSLCLKDVEVLHGPLCQVPADSCRLALEGGVSTSKSLVRVWTLHHLAMGSGTTSQSPPSFSKRRTKVVFPAAEHKTRRYSSCHVDKNTRINL